MKPLHITKANIWSHDNIEQHDLYCTDVVLDAPAPNSLVVDLEGLTVFPGLINAHDHLELNHYPRTKFREVYNNAHEWGEDVDKRLDTEPYKSLRQYPIWDRLFIGGLKNLLCGATTVAHHGPKYREMYRTDFPVRVLKNYGWSHSLHFDSEEDIVKSYQSTPKEHPWFIHLAEGTDGVAQNEYQRLKDLDCIGENTVIVHGVGLIYEDSVDWYLTRKSNMRNRIPIVLCPSTNDYLLHGLINLRIVNTVSSPMIGSDSRLTANGDLLDEIEFIKDNMRLAPSEWIIMSVTQETSQIMGINAGKLARNYVADMIVVEQSNEPPLFNINRSKLKLVVKGGIPQIGDPDIMAKFPHIETVSGLLDGVPKSINSRLARQIQKCKLKERGLDLLETPAKRFWIF